MGKNRFVLKHLDFKGFDLKHLDFKGFVLKHLDFKGFDFNQRYCQKYLFKTRK